MTNPNVPGQNYPASPKKGMPLWLIVLLVILLLLGLGCCGGLATCWYVGSRAVTSIKEEVDKAGITMDGSLPASFPKDVPVYSGFKPVFAVAPKGESKGTVTFTGKGNVADVGDFYEKIMKDNGWTQTSSQNTGDGLTQIYTKGDREASIHADSSTDGGSLVITYGKKEGGDTEPKEPADEAPVPARNTGGNANRTPANADETPAPARTSPDANIAGSSKMPANFPNDVPIFTGLTPSFSFADRTKGSGSVTLSGKIDKEKAVTYYEKQLTDKGWKQEQHTDFGSGSVLIYAKENRKLNMTFVPDADKGETMVTISYETQQ